MQYLMMNDQSNWHENQAFVHPYLVKHAVGPQQHLVHEMKTSEFANSIHPVEVASNEPPHLYLHC